MSERASGENAPDEGASSQRELSPRDMTVLLKSLGFKRDREVFARLFVFYAPRIKAYLMRQGVDAAAAEELAQESMLTVWQKAALFDATKASASTWIFTIVRNLKIDALRKHRPAFDPNDPHFVPDPPPTPDRDWEEAEIQGRVRAAMDGLPGEQATVVRLAFFEDKPHSEIATELALPLGTVKSRLRLALRRLAALLGRDP